MKEPEKNTLLAYSVIRAPRRWEQSIIEALSGRINFSYNQQSAWLYDVFKTCINLGNLEFWDYRRPQLVKASVPRWARHSCQISSSSLPIPGDSHIYINDSQKQVLPPPSNHCLMAPPLIPSSLPGSRFNMLILSLEKLIILFVVSSEPYFPPHRFPVLPCFHSHLLHSPQGPKVYPNSSLSIKYRQVADIPWGNYLLVKICSHCLLCLISEEWAPTEPSHLWSSILKPSNNQEVREESESREKEPASLCSEINGRGIAKCWDNVEINQHCLAV